MNTAKIQNLLLKRLASSETLLLAIVLNLGEPPKWIDGRDSDGRSIFLVGRHKLGTSEDAKKGIAVTLEILAKGSVPSYVHVVSYAPKASEAISTIVDDKSANEILMDGERGSGKTQSTPG